MHVDETLPSIQLLEDINWRVRPLPTTIPDAEIARLGLRIIPTLGGGQCVFNVLRNHLVEFNRGSEAGDNQWMRKKLVDYLTYDPEGIRFRNAAMKDVNVRLLLRCHPRQRTTWPTIECFYPFCNLYNLKVTIFVTVYQKKGEKCFYEVQEFWPQNSPCPEYPPVPSENWMCVRYDGKFENCELLLPKRTRKRKSAQSLKTPEKSGRPPRSRRVCCQCKGYCGNWNCICLKEGRECSKECHPNNTECKNHIHLYL